jgi:hypothetical protein
MRDGQRDRDDDVGLGAQGVPDPAFAHLLDVFDRGDRGAGLIDQGRVDGVHSRAPTCPTALRSTRRVRARQDTAETRMFNKTGLSRR